MKKADRDALLTTLQQRFEKYSRRHPKVAWSVVAERLDGKTSALKVLKAMEDSGGEPDVIAVDGKSGVITFADCSAESPTGRRSLCFDGEALEARKEAKPAGSAMQMAADMGVELMSEAEYRTLQELGAFDTKTSSWVQTPAAIRALGGALFCDRRYETVFVYHNGAQSYYAARGFRGVLRV